MNLHTHSAALIFQLASLALLIIATITSPVLTTIYLAHDSSYRYGVFGYCPLDAKSAGDCSKAAANYKPSSLTDSGSNWKMGAGARDKLALILIVAPIAAGLTFISVIFNILSHLVRTFMVSKVYWSFSLFFTILSFLSSALICVVTFLLFYPNVDWPAWCLIPAAVLNMISIIMVGLAMKILPTFGEYDDDDNDDDDDPEKEKYGNGSRLLSEFQDNNKFVEPPSIYIEKNRSVFTVNSDKSDSNTISKNITSSTFDNSQLENKTNTNIVSENITSSTFDNENDGIKSDAQSSVYDESLKLPQISNPYLNDSLLNDMENRTADSNFDNRLINSSSSNLQQIEKEGSDSNSSDSNFTSVSQRGINPNYYRGATSKSQFPQSQSAPIPYNQYANPYIQSNHPSHVQNQIPNQTQIHNQNQQIGGPSYPQYRGNYQQNFNYSSVPQNSAGIPPPQQQYGYQKKVKPYMVMGMKNGYANKSQYQNAFPANNTSGSMNNYQRRFGPNTAPLPNQFSVPSSYKGRQKGYMPSPSAISNDGPYGRLT